MSELALSSNQQIDDSNAPIIASNSIGESRSTDPFETLRAWTRQPAIRQIIPVFGLVFVVAAALAAWLFLREPPQRDLFRGLPERDKAQIAEVLQKSNIGFSIDQSTGALSVSTDDYHTAKMMLAAEGLPRSAPDGDSLISSMPMGSSRAVENEKLRSAREIDLARTIEAIDVVNSARVHLAVEAPSIFIRDRSKPSASVMLNMVKGQALSDAQVQSIVHLVASSVPGLSADQVSVVDQHGTLMSQLGLSTLSNIAGQQLSIKTQQEGQYRSALMSLLTPILGAENFTAEVSAELDFDEKQATRETFPQEDARIRSEQGSWSNEPGQKPAFGIPGALSNRPPVEATVEDRFDDDANDKEVEEKADRTSENFNRQYELGREVSVTKQASGVLKRISVAVALRSPVGKKQRSKEELAAIEALVKGAIGFNAERGDQVAIEARDFRPVEPVIENWWEADWISLLVRNLTALLVALALVFGIGRPIVKKLITNRRAVEAKKDVQLAGEINAELDRQNPSAMRSANPVSLDMIEDAQGYAERASLIQHFVRQDPDRAALVVKDLLSNQDKDQELEDA